VAGGLEGGLMHASLTPRAELWRRARRILAVRLDNLGDLLMTTPALAALHESLPGASLTLLGGPSAGGAAPHLPMLDAIWPVAMPWTAQGRDHPQDDDAQPGGAERALVERLAKENFDAAVIFTVCTQSALPAALLCRMAGIPLRLAHCRENPYGLLTDWVPEADRIGDGMRHEVQRQLDLVAAVGCSTRDERLRWRVADADREAVAARLEAHGVAPGQAYAVLHPGATAATRRWPAERFGILAAELVQRTGIAVVFAGDSGDLPAVASALAAMPAARHDAPIVSLAGELGLGELAALIGEARLVVCNNSAPAHLAAAAGTPVACLYALTNPQHTPWRVRSEVLNQDVPCRWCLKSVCPQQHHRCLRDVEPPQVLEAALRLLRGVPVEPALALSEDRSARLLAGGWSFL
jgi:lipopolysaccharide heptosyltransferase II